MLDPSHRPACAAVAALLLATPGLAPAGEGHGHAHGAASAPRPSIFEAGELLEAARAGLPPPPPGVTHLDLGELFGPVGRRGLEYSGKARALDGRIVRVLGYMARQDLPVAGTLLLAPYPFTLHETEYGFAEDLPGSTLHVVVPGRAGEQVPHTPGLLLLTGQLDLGPREEPDGRVSVARLTLLPSPAARAAGAEQPANSPHPREEQHP